MFEQGGVPLTDEDQPLLGQLSAVLALDQTSKGRIDNGRNQSEMHGSQPLLPISVYNFSVSVPLNIIFVGTDEPMKEETGYLLDGLEHSRYTNLMQMAAYNPSQRNDSHSY